MLGPVAIRPARRCEQRTLEALQLRASLMNEGDRAHLLAHPDAVELPLAQIEAGCVLVAEGDGSILGFSVVLPRDDGNAELDGLFVEPSQWRNGVGRMLLEAAAAFAAAKGAYSLRVIGNLHAVGFYERCGFEPCGEAQTLFGTAPVLRMTLRY
jgi:GNAT superfamily N-acetyltransferase